jgi:hypothetical protein
MKLHIMQSLPASFHFISLVGPNILLSTLSVRDQVSHPYKTTGKIMVLYQRKLHAFWNLWVISETERKPHHSLLRSSHGLHVDITTKKKSSKVE